MARFLRKTGQLTLAFALLFMGACQKTSDIESEKSAKLTPIQLQLDWFPEPAHGGFYQALHEGFYEDVGLAVEILPGGPGGRPTQKVASGQVPFSMGRSDDMILAAAEGLPVLIVAGLMQHDPQALLLHQESPVNTFVDLDGRAVMAYPGAAWIPYLQKRFDIEFDLLPMSFGLARFMADPDLIQACFVTDEPYRLRQEGVPVRTLLLSDSGYDPYRVIVAHRPFAEENPEIVRAFVAATIRGWDDYILGNPARAHGLIAQENDHMTQDQMVYSHSEMIIQRFVEGDPAADESIGALDPERLNQHAKLLHALGVLENPLPLEAYADLSFLPHSE